MSPVQRKGAGRNPKGSAAPLRGPWIQQRGPHTPCPHRAATRRPSWLGDFILPPGQHASPSPVLAGQKRLPKMGQAGAAQAVFPHPSPTELEQDKLGGKGGSDTQDRSRASSGRPGPGQPPSQQVAAAQKGLQGKRPWVPWVPRPGRTFTLRPAKLPVGGPCPTQRLGGIGQPSHPLQGSLLPAAAQVLV